MNLFQNNVNQNYTKNPFVSTGSHSAPARSSANAAVPASETATTGTANIFLEIGQILKGEVANLINREVQIILSNGTFLQARLDSSTLLSIGQTALFEVLQNKASQIVLRLLPENQGQAQNTLIGKALDAADLPATERNITIVNELLANRLPIDKESIHRIIQQSISYKNASVSTLAIMNKYNIPVNEINTTQFEAYRNYEHRILQQITSLSQDITAQLTAENSEASSMTRLLTQMLTNPKMTGSSEAVEFSTVVEQEGRATILITGDKPISDIVIPVSSTENTPFSALISPAESLPSSSVPEIEPAEIIMQASSDLMTTGSSDKIHSGLQASDILALLAAQSPESTEAIRSVLTGQLIKRWTFSPKTLEQEGAIDKYYEQLEEDLEHISTALKHNTKEPTIFEKNITKTVQNLQDNLSFLKTLNQMFTYLQLPMRLQEKTTHGELYVYTNKKELRRNNANISVLLHLDMDRLGPIDIYLSLSGKSLATKFYLDDDSDRELLETYLPELKETLENKGFIMTNEVLSRQKDTSILTEFMLSEESGMDMKRFTFDVRA